MQLLIISPAESLVKYQKEVPWSPWNMGSLFLHGSVHSDPHYGRGSHVLSLGGVVMAWEANPGFPPLTWTQRYTIFQELIRKMLVQTSGFSGSFSHQASDIFWIILVCFQGPLEIFHRQSKEGSRRCHH